MPESNRSLTEVGRRTPPEIGGACHFHIVDTGDYKNETGLADRHLGRPRLPIRLKLEIAPGMPAIMAIAKRKKAEAEDAIRNADRASSGSRGELGDRLRSIRRKRGWTLDQASGATGVARSTLSKIENGAMSPTFDLIQKLAQGLSVDLVQLFGGGAVGGAPGRRSLMLHNSGPVLESSTYSHALLAADLSKKRMLPFLSRIKARSLGDFSEMNRHQGDVFLYVVDGEIEFYSEYYSPVKMSSGQSVYFDGQMEHALVSISQSDAEVLWVCDNWSGQNDVDV